MLTPSTTPSHETGHSTPQSAGAHTALAPLRGDHGELKLPPPLPVELPLPELPPNYISIFERGLTAVCKGYPGAGLRFIRFLPVSFTTKQRIAEAVFADARLPNVVNLLPLLRLPPQVQQRILNSVIERTIAKPEGPTSFWQAISLKVRDPLEAHERLSLALRCVAYDPARAAQEAGLFNLDTLELKIPFAKSCARVGGISVARTLSWLPELGREAPEQALEIAETCIEQSPLKSAAHLSVFGLPLAPLVERVLQQSGDRSRWKVIAALCANSDMTEELRTTLALTSFEHAPHETLRRLETFKLAEGDTVRTILLQGVTVLPNAVVAYLQNHAIPLYREIAEQVLWPRVAGAPWDSADLALKTEVQDQQLLSALIEETFKRDATRALRFIDANKHIAQGTLAGLVERLASIDAAAVMRGLKRFGPISPPTFLRIALEYAKAAPEKAFDLLRDERLKEPGLRRNLVLAVASSRRGAAIVIENFRRAYLPEQEDRKAVAVRCLQSNPEVTLSKLCVFSLSERTHAEIAVEQSGGSRKKLRELLATLGVYSPQACAGLIPESALKDVAHNQSAAALDAVLNKARTHPAEVASTIRNFGVVNEHDRVAIALQCFSKAPKKLAENLLAFGLYSDAARRAVALAMATKSPERTANIISLCGVISPSDVSELLVPVAMTKPQRLRELFHLLQGASPIELFAKAFSDSIARENWGNTLALSQVCAELKLQREPRQSEILAAFDALTLAVRKHASLSENISYPLSLIERIRRAGTVPERSVLRAFSIFDEHGDAFIVEVLQTAGPTSGANIVEELSRIYKRKKTIPPADQTIIREFIAADFRGFSSSTLSAAKRAFAESPEKGRKLIAGWKEIARTILTGKGIEPSLEEDSIYPNLVYAAYRPVDMSVADVRKHLMEVSDWTQHLAPFRYPENGYPVKLVELDDVQLKTNEALTTEALRATSRFLTDALHAEHACSHDDFIQILVKASQRGIDSIDKHKFAYFLARNYPDPRLHAAARDLQALSWDTVAPQRAFEGIARMKEFFDVVHGDMLESALRDYFEGGKLPLREQFKARIRNLLRLPPEHELTTAQIREAVRGELTKVWRHDRTLLNREGRKFTQQAGAMFADYRMYVTKSRASFFGRAGAGLCTGDDMWSWNNKDFLQMIMVDERKDRVVGNIQLHIFEGPDQKRSILARLNPTEKFLLSVSGKTLAREMLACVQKFADENDLVPYLPHDGDHLHLLTNRASFAPHLKARYGEEFDHAVKVASWLTVESVYRLSPATP